MWIPCGDSTWDTPRVFPLVIPFGDSMGISKGNAHGGPVRYRCGLELFPIPIPRLINLLSATMSSLYARRRVGWGVCKHFTWNDAKWIAAFSRMQIASRRLFTVETQLC